MADTDRRDCPTPSSWGWYDSSLVEHFPATRLAWRVTGDYRFTRTCLCRRSVKRHWGGQLTHTFLIRKNHYCFKFVFWWHPGPCGSCTLLHHLRRLVVVYRILDCFLNELLLRCWPTQRKLTQLYRPLPVSSSACTGYTTLHASKHTQRSLANQKVNIINKFNATPLPPTRQTRCIIIHVHVLVQDLLHAHAHTCSTHTDNVLQRA